MRVVLSLLVVSFAGESGQSHLTGSQNVLQSYNNLCFGFCNNLHSSKTWLGAKSSICAKSTERVGSFISKQNLLGPGYRQMFESVWGDPLRRPVSSQRKVPFTFQMTVNSGEEVSDPVVEFGDVVTIYFLGTYLDGVVFQTNREGEPFEFEIGARKVVKGIENMVN